MSKCQSTISTTNLHPILNKSAKDCKNQAQIKINFVATRGHKSKTRKSNIINRWKHKEKVGKNTNLLILWHNRWLVSKR
jgi:hypothetical protein